MPRNVSLVSAVVSPLGVLALVVSCAQTRDYSGPDASSGSVTEDETTEGNRNTDASQVDNGSQSVGGSTQADAGGIMNVVTVSLGGAADGGDAGAGDAGSSDGGRTSEPDGATQSPTATCAESADCDDGNECNGVETCNDDGACEAGQFEDNGAICGGSAEDLYVCRGGNCLKSRCGDKIVDGRLEEACDDGDVSNGDGCDVDCTYSCTADEDCDDANVCNGSETCDTETHVCAKGTAAEDATECGTERACFGGRCLSTSCGDDNVAEDEECDDGNQEDGDGCTAECQFDCEADLDCNDQNECNGLETCDLETHTCLAGETKDCDDDVPCTDDQCEPGVGCVNHIYDEDGDGQSPIVEGAECGTDCDDSDENVFAGAGELCDGVDNNCDGNKDEIATVWYPDCDGDGYTPHGSVGVQQCDQPKPPIECPDNSLGTWTIRAPSEGEDCWDYDPNIYPRMDAEWSSTAIDGRKDYPYDYDCNLYDEPKIIDVGVQRDASCSPLVLTPIQPPIEVSLLQVLDPDLELDPTVVEPALQLKCYGRLGWMEDVAPACGQPGTYTYCDGCTRAIESGYLQPCK